MANNRTSDDIEAAIVKAISETEEHEEGDMVIEWALIAYVSNPSPDRGDAYPMFFSNGEIPTYRGIGLFHTALKYLDQDINEGD